MPRGRKTRSASVAPVSSRVLRRRAASNTAPEVPSDNSTPPPRKRQRNNPSSSSSTDHQLTPTSSGRPLTDQDVPSIVKAVLDALPAPIGSSDRDPGHTVASSSQEIPRKFQKLVYFDITYVAIATYIVAM